MVQFSKNVKSSALPRAASVLRRLVLICLLMVLGLSLTACGKKPSFVDPPEETPAGSFPRTYPDPETDPAS